MLCLCSGARAAALPTAARGVGTVGLRGERTLVEKAMNVDCGLRWFGCEWGGFFCVMMRRWEEWGLCTDLLMQTVGLRSSDVIDMSCRNDMLELHDLEVGSE